MCNRLYVRVLAIIIALIIFSSTAYGEMNPSKVSRTKYPLFDMRGIVVDKEGNIFVGVKFFSIIQVYDKKGKFKFSFKIHAGGGDYKIVLDANGNIKVATIRGDALFTYDNSGNLINYVPDYQAYSQPIQEKRFIDDNKNIYEIKNPLLIFPHVTKTTTNGEKDIIITDTPLAILVRVSLFFLISGILLYLAHEKLRQWKQEKNQHR